MSEANGSTLKTAFLGAPAYRGITMRAAQAFFRATAGKLTLHLSYQQASLLNANCNSLWAWALNAAHQGRPIDYFSMLHSDVQPPDFWLDSLVEELEARDLDVLSVVVPIKDPRGLTSTAIGHPDGHSDADWRPRCRVTMREVYDLPETFTAADLGFPDSPLLINTGCFVCRFNRNWNPAGWWAERLHFACRDRIVFDEKANVYRPQTFPEDWHFAQQCYRLGLKVGATRKVPLTHRGEIDFANDHPWGQEFDSEYLTEPVIQRHPQTDGWAFPHQVEGWLSESEGRALARLADSKDVLEIGSYCGRSTICLARTARRVECIDTWDGRGTPTPRDTFRTFRANLERFGVEKKVYAYYGSTEQIAPDLPESSYDLVFVDGAHDLASVHTDILHACRVLRPGGLLAFHDYQRPCDPEVTQAVDDLLAEGGELLELIDTLAVVRPPCEKRAARQPALTLSEVT